LAKVSDTIAISSSWSWDSLRALDTLNPLWAWLSLDALRAGIAGISLWTDRSLFALGPLRSGGAGGTSWACFPLDPLNALRLPGPTLIRNLLGEVDFATA
jgi:hypothetical protein